MPLSLILGCLWALIACLIAMGPARFHWPAAWGLIATGIPLLGFITFQAGPLWGLVALAGGASVLRWPLIVAARQMRRAVKPVDPE